MAIERIGKVYRREDGMTVVEGWHIRSDDTRVWTDEDWLALAEYIAQRVADRLNGCEEPPEPVTGDTEIFRGWTLSELAELSITLGEGAVLP